MSINHHPHDEILAAYAAGALDLGQRVAVATHLATCPRCRDWTRSMERVGGALLADAAARRAVAGRPRARAGPARRAGAADAAAPAPGR